MQTTGKLHQIAPLASSKEVGLIAPGFIARPPRITIRCRCVRPPQGACKLGIVSPSRPGVGSDSLTGPINSLDTSALSDVDRIEIEQLQAAYDRAGPKAVAKGMARLAKTRPELFGWLVKKLTE